MKDQPAPTGFTKQRGLSVVAHRVRPGEVHSVPGTNVHVYHNEPDDEYIFVYPDGTLKLVGPGDWFVQLGDFTPAAS